MNEKSQGAWGTLYQSGGSHVSLNRGSKCIDGCNLNLALVRVDPKHKFCRLRLHPDYSE